jgi:mannose-1-phosphate guanylyltransferase
MSNSFYALILAGGSGMRFWPLSRRAAPKQLLRLFSNRTLLGETLERLRGLVPPENIFILTNKEQEASVRKLLPKHPAENIFSEPTKRDTAAAIALGVGLVAKRDASATMAVLPADHRIPDKVAFQKDMRIAAAAAEQSGNLVTIGVTPTWACPGFGYIERGKKLSGASADLYEVVRFREKPNSDLAESFVRSGNFYWNAGMFIWTVKAILTELNRHAPDLAEFVSAIRHTDDREKILKERFPALRKLSIDYAIMEKASRVLVKPATFEWDDVGNWSAIAKYLQSYPGENSANCRLTTEQASNNVVFSQDRLDVALLGVRDLIVVQTKDAILVCNRHEVESLKKLVEVLPEELQ